MEQLVDAEYERYMLDIKYLDHIIKIYVANGQCIITKKRGKLKIKHQNTTINIDTLTVENIT